MIEYIIVLAAFVVIMVSLLVTIRFNNRTIKAQNESIIELCRILYSTTRDITWKRLQEYHKI